MDDKEEQRQLFNLELIKTIKIVLVENNLTENITIYELFQFLSK